MEEVDEVPSENAPREDTVARFAADLRALRLTAGSPTLARLQSDTHISRTVLSEAFTGRLLPSARTVDGIVRACGGDTSEWMPRRDALAQKRVVSAAALPEDQGVEDSQAAKPEPAGRGRTLGAGSAAALIAAAFVIGAVVSGLASSGIAWQIYSQQPAAAETGPQIAVSNGDDPALTACVDDAEVATSDTRAGNSLLEIIWSDKCYAGWGRITRYDGLGHGNTLTIAIYPQTSSDGPDRQETTELGVQGAYTTLVVRPSSDTMLCADGSFTVDGERVDLGEPLCI